MEETNADGDIQEDDELFLMRTTICSIYRAYGSDSSTANASGARRVVRASIRDRFKPVHVGAYHFVISLHGKMYMMTSPVLAS